MSNGYIAIELGGELRALKFNMMAMNVALNTIDWENYAATANYAYVYGGLIGHYYAVNRTTDGFPYKFEDVMDWVDALDDETMTAINNCLVDSHAYRKVEDAAAKEAEKITAEEKKSEPLTNSMTPPGQD